MHPAILSPHCWRTNNIFSIRWPWRVWVCGCEWGCVGGWGMVGSGGNVKEKGTRGMPMIHSTFVLYLILISPEPLLMFVSSKRFFKQIVCDVLKKRIIVPRGSPVPFSPIVTHLCVTETKHHLPRIALSQMAFTDNTWHYFQVMAVHMDIFVCDPSSKSPSNMHSS